MGMSTTCGFMAATRGKFLSFFFFFFPLPSFLVFLSRNPNYNDTIITVEKKKYGEKTNIINENNDSISNKPPKEVRIHLDAIMLVIPYSYSP